MKALLAFVFIALTFVVRPAAAERIKIGVSTPLTGDAATYGVDLRNVLQFANDHLAQGRYELIFEDDKCNGRDAVTVAHKLISVDKVKYVLGFPCSGALIPSAALYEKAGVLVVAAGASAENISHAGDFIFRTWPSDTAAVKALYDQVSKRHKNLAVLSEETDYAQAFLKSLNGLNTSGALSIYGDTYLPAERDFRSVLLRLKARGADALFLNSQTEASMNAILKDLRALRWDVPLFNAWFAGSAKFLSSQGAGADGIAYVDFAPLDEALCAEGKHLFKDFSDKFGKINSVDIIFMTGFESFRAVHDAIQSGEDARSYLYKKKFKGVFGEWFFDSFGDIQGLSPIMRTIKDGKPAALVAVP